MALSAKFEEVDPETARKWLSEMGYNRLLRPRVVTQYARQMLGRTWQDTGEPIQFNEHGKLNNGQHRLHAIIESGATLKMLVVRGVPEGAQTAMDQGAKRSAGDALGYLGFKNVNLLAATARLALSEQQGLLVNSRSDPGHYGHDEIVAFVHDNPDVVDAVNYVSTRKANITGLVPAAMAFTYWKFNRLDPVDAHEFYAAMFEMRTGGEGDPRLALMRRLTSVAGQGNRPSVTGSWMVIRTWNAWRSKQPLAKILVESGGSALGWLTPV